jgi:hypothetical protein
MQLKTVDNQIIQNKVVKIFGCNKKVSTFALPIRNEKGVF